MTNSTTSTATPPKLMETDLSLEGSGEMGNIFEGVGVDKRRSRVLENIPTNISQVRDIPTSIYTPFPTMGHIYV